MKLPWAEPGSRFTALFEAPAIDRLRAASHQAVADRLSLSWYEVHAIQERAVKRGLERRKAEPIARFGVDEKSFTRGHHYFTIVNDLDRSRVLFVAEHRTAESTQPPAGGASKIVFDKFHIAKHLSEAVDQAWRRENKLLRARGDDRLAGTRCDWLRRPAGEEPNDREESAALRDSNLKTARAWALKEGMMPSLNHRHSAGIILFNSLPGAMLPVGHSHH